MISSSFYLNEPLISKEYCGLNLNYFYLQKDRNGFLIGQASKRDFKSVAKKNYSNKDDLKNFWSNNEYNEINLLINQNKVLRLIDWVIIRILLKFGLLIYLKIHNIPLDIYSKDILLKKNKWNKPIIEINSDLYLKKFEKIPYISVSHSKENIFIVFSSNPVGFDAEVVHEHSVSWINKIYSKKERENFFVFLKRWNNLSNKTIDTIMWVLKESALKIENGFPLGLISEISIEIIDDKITTIIPRTNNRYQNYFSIHKDSVLALTI